MLLICATPATIQRGYRALLEAARAGAVSQRRIQASLKRIAATKALVKPPTPLDVDKYNRLSNEIQRLNETLEYRYPGESNVQ